MSHFDESASPASGDDEAEFLRARGEISHGNAGAARDRLLALRARLARPSAMLELQLGYACQQLGDTAAAMEAAHAAIRLAPGLAAAHELLAALWLGLARVETESGDAAAAIASLANAVAAGPRQALMWAHIGYLYAEHLMYAQASQALSSASALDPGAAEVESVRAGVMQELGDYPGAMQALALAASRDPDDLRVAFAQRLFLPQTYDSVDDVAAWRRRFSEGLRSLEREEERWLPKAADVFRLTRSNFFLAYQGEDDRELQERYMGLVARLAGAAVPHLRAPLAPASRGSRRIRVGFFGNVFRESTAGFYFERWVTRLDAARFERVVYHTAPVVDALTRRVAAAADRFVHRRLDTRATAEMLRSDELDILVYPEVGMSSTTLLLAALRLAPVQCAGWGHPVTTGSDAIDYYLTCSAMEPPDADAHYTERLIGLPGIGVDYAMPAREPRVERRELGLPDGARVYMCAQSLFKVHPEMDDAFASILGDDPQGLLVFFQAGARAVTEQLAARIQRALAKRGIPPRAQVKFLPRLPGAQFRAALSVADVVLDTFGWSGGNTTLDALAAGVPVVTMPGRFMRGRQTAAMLEMLGLQELVARDPAGFARVAKGLAADRDFNAGARQAIAARRVALFDRGEPVAALQEALLKIAPG
jgi:predicted O-linked N-acetylglucosamine transferase (SPINDLY family)